MEEKKKPQRGKQERVHHDSKKNLGRKHHEPSVLGRKQNILKPLFSKHLSKKHIVGFDVETHGITNQFYMGGVYDDKGFIPFYNRKEMGEFILENQQYRGNCYIVATNLAFDFSVLYYNTKYWNKFKIIMNGSRMIACSYKTRNGSKITFVDSLNYVMMSVAQMGKILGIEKLESPKCLGRLPKNHEEKMELEVYNKRDCEVTYKFMTMLQEGFHEEGAKMKLTIASTSMDLFRRKYLRFWLFKEEYTLKSPKVKKFLFNGYYGGRTENFNRGEIKNKIVYDINSLYPSVMVGEYPNPNYVKMSNSPTSFLLQYEGVSKVRIKAPKIHYPLLPVRSEGKLIFPSDCTFTGTFSHVELRKALELGYELKKMFKTIYYKKNFYPFKDFISTLYHKRREYQREKNQLEHTMKILMNSSYGKFGQKQMTDIKFFNTKYLDNEELESFHKDDERNIVMKDEFNGFEIAKKESNQAFVFPIFALYTTAKARLVLYDFLVKYRGLYCDTDSLVTGRSMPTSSKLGDMKVEYKIKKGLLIKPKMYMYERFKGDPIVKLKGVPRITQNKFASIVRGENVTYKKFSKLKESVRRGFEPNTIMDITKNINLEDTKRKWGSLFSPYEFQSSVPLQIKD